MGKLSKSVMKQVLAMDVVESVCEGLEHTLVRDPDEDLKDATAILHRIRRNKDNWFRQAVGAELLVLDPVELRRYKRALAAMREVIVSHCGKEAEAVEYLNAVLLFAEDVYAEVPKSPAARKDAAGETVSSLVALYELYDPELEAHEQIRSGGDFGERIKKASGCW